MTILVTGGAGFIGSHLTKRLEHLGRNVVILDDFNDYYSPQLKYMNIAQFQDSPSVNVIEGDIRDGTLLERIFDDHKIRKVVHLAALAGVRNSVNEANRYYQVNVMGSLQLLEAARRFGIEQFILASTSSVYGKTSKMPFTEDAAADQPLAPYPASKRAAEILAHSYHHQFQMNITCLRFFNVYGPFGRPDMMPIKVLKAVYADEPITLFDDGRLSRDWTYIDDIVNGVVAALNRPLGYKIMNLGYGAPISMNEFVDCIENLSGQKVQRINQAAPLSEPPITYCDNRLARDLLDFKPQIQVYEGLRRTWEWYTTTGIHILT